MTKKSERPRAEGAAERVRGLLPVIPHKYRTIVIGLAFVAALVATVAGDRFGLDEETREAAAALLLVLIPGFLDALAVEGRRRDPSQPAIPDDLRGPLADDDDDA